MARALACLGVVISFCAACGPQAAGAGSSGVGTASSSEASLPPMSAEDLATAVEFRARTGLQTDEAWIRSVAADPSSNRIAYRTPLTLAEKADLDARPHERNEIESLIDAYGRSRSDWAGLFLEQVDHDRYVANFAGPVDAPAVWLAAHVSPVMHWRVRQVRWSLAELAEFEDRITRDEGFLATVQARFVASGARPDLNRVWLEISSANPEAPAAIVGHFDGADWLTVVSDGIGPWTGPRGTLEIHVTTPDGQPIEDAACLLTSDGPEVFDTGDMGMGTASDGRLHLVGVAATWVTVKAFKDVGGIRYEGQTKVLVVADAVTIAEVVLDLP